MSSNMVLKKALSTTRPTAIAEASYDVRVSSAAEDQEWDAFLSTASGGHHVQTSMWSRVKSTVGWQFVRIIVRREGEIVAGAQVLMRPLPVAGAIGYVPKGPLCVLRDPSLLNLVMTKLHRVARERRVQLLILQPPDDGDWIERWLQARGFRTSPFEAFPAATVLLDLRQDLDTILADMKSKTRYNIRLGLRKGMTAREGSPDEMAAFYKILHATSERQEFSVNDENYYTQTANIFGRHDHFKLFVSEYEGEIVSAMFVIAFGDTVLFKRGGWSGRHGALRPNEVMHWAAIQWAKTAGYRYYNFEGINLDAARAHLAGAPLDANLLKSVTRFKLGFGGEVRLLPGVYDYVYNPMARWGYRTLYPRLESSGLLERVLSFVRSR